LQAFVTVIFPPTVTPGAFTVIDSSLAVPTVTFVVVSFTVTVKLYVAGEFGAVPMMLTTLPDTLELSPLGKPDTVKL
jgi:hypothetical protein